MSSTTIIAQFLDKGEVAALKKELDEAGINCIVKRHGLPLFLGNRYATYRVYVDAAHAAKGGAIAKTFMDNLQQNRKEFEALLLRQCPVCESPDICVKNKASLYDKIYYMGVTVRQCKECASEWYT